MKTRLIPILTAALAAGSTITAFADLPQLDSAKFAYKYEMVTLPTAEDIDGNGKKDFTGAGTWLTLGTGANLGTASMVITGSQALKADAAAVNSDGDVWRRMDAQTGANGTGYTVEARIKVTESTGSIGAFLLNASTGDSSINSWLVFRTDSLYWGNGTDKKLMDLDATVWHDYRIVREPGSLLHSVYVDGTLVANDLPNGISASVNRIFLGAANASYAGKGEVMWLRFHKGAFAPLPADYKPPRKSSSDFPIQYEMSSSDNRISTTGNTGDWTISGTSDVTISKENGLLSVVPSTGKQPYWRTTDSAWKTEVTENTAFTVDVSAKINSCTIASGDRTLQIWAATPRAIGNLIIGENHVYWQVTSSMNDNILLDSNNNTDGKHVFRITYDGATRHGFTVWRDGVKIGENLVDLTTLSAASYTFVRFGIPGSTSGGAFDIDYIRWDTTGAYDWKDPRKGLQIKIR